jgi:periplasmic divalent cation tolerance protein
VSTPALVLTTIPMDMDDGTFARTVVDERLAACVSVLPEMRSIYRWEGKVEDTRERQVVIKTTRERVPDLLKRLRTLHPYDVPEFIVLPIVDGSPDYLRWLSDSTT